MSCRARAALLPLVYLALAACVSAAPPTAPATPTAPAEHVLTVRSIGPEGPVVEATVCAARPGRAERCAVADANGVARLSLEPGIYQVRAEAPAGRRLVAGIAAVDLAAARELAVALEGRSEVRGTVRDEAGALVVAARVCAHPAGAEPPACERTGPDGAFLIEVPRAVVKLHVEGPPDGSRLLSQWAVGRVSSFEADLYDARRGDVEGIEIGLRKGVLLTGTVRADGDARAIEAAQVCTSALSAPLGWDCTLTDEDGRYAALRDPGQYWVWIIPPGERGSRLIPQRYDRALTGFDSDRFDLRTDRELDVALREGVLLHGRVTAEDGTPVVLAFVCADTPFPTGRICRVTADDGSYEIATRPETYVVNVIAPEGSDLVSSYWDRKRDWTEADRVVVRGDRRLDILLERGVRVAGVVRDHRGRPVEGATLNLMDGRGAIVATSTDHRGAYVLAAPAGRYRMDVFPPRVAELQGVVDAPLALGGVEVGFDVVLPDIEVP